MVGRSETRRGRRGGIVITAMRGRSRGLRLRSGVGLLGGGRVGRGGGGEVTLDSC